MTLLRNHLPSWADQPCFTRDSHLHSTCPGGQEDLDSERPKVERKPEHEHGRRSGRTMVWVEKE
jgi:hypothetical protein